MVKYLSKEEFEEYFIYNPKTGEIRNRVRKHSAKEGAIAGFVIKTRKNKNPYRVVKVKCKQYLAHRVAWIMAGNELKEGMVMDHINGNGLDNRIENLRMVTRSENGTNRKLADNNSSGKTGVHFYEKDKLWVASYRNTYIGSSKNLEEAINMRKNYEIEHNLVCLS